MNKFQIICWIRIRFKSSGIWGHVDLWIVTEDSETLKVFWLNTEAVTSFICYLCEVGCSAPYKHRNQDTKPITARSSFKVQSFNYSYKTAIEKLSKLLQIRGSR